MRLSDNSGDELPERIKDDVCETNFSQVYSKNINSDLESPQRSVAFVDSV